MRRLILLLILLFGTNVYAASSSFLVIAKGEGFVPVTENLIKFVSTIPEIEDVKYRMGTTELGILNPEQYRSELTKLIAEDAERLKSEIGGFDNIEISGLESPVLVSQRNDTDVTLYIHYKISIEK